MKRFIIFLFILLPFGKAGMGFAQTFKLAADTEFFYTYGGTNFDEARDIKETPDKGYIVVGTTSSFGQGATSVYMIKTDSLGNHKWSGVQGGALNDHAYTVELTYDNGFFVSGYSNSFYTNNSFDYSAYYFKTDATGHLLWQKFIDKGAWSFIYGSCPVKQDSGFILCGQTYATTNGDADAYLIRVNKNGDTLWTKHYGGAQDEVFNSVCIINNRIYAVGSNGSHAGADSIADGWIVKLEMNGNKLQDTFMSFGANFKEILNGITPYNDSLFTVCGANKHIDSNVTTSIITRYDTALLFNQDINTLYGLTHFPSGSFAAFNKVINISYSSICVIGSATGGLGGTNMLFEGFSSGGWWINDYVHHSGGAYNDYGYSGIYTSGGKVIGVGSTLSTQEYCTNANLGLEDVFLVRYNCDSILGASITNTHYTCFADTLSLSQASIKNYTSNATIKLFPNPTSTNAQLDIKCNEQKTYTAHIFSVLGNEVMNLKVYSNQSNQLDFSLLSEGTYFLKLQDENGQNTSVLKFIINR